MTNPPTSQEAREAAELMPTVTEADNRQALVLSNWLFENGFFDEDGSPQHVRLWQEFGALADQAFARHREFGQCEVPPGFLCIHEFMAKNSPSQETARSADVGREAKVKAILEQARDGTPAYRLARINAALAALTTPPADDATKVCPECDPPGCGKECRGGDCHKCGGSGRLSVEPVAPADDGGLRSALTALFVAWDKHCAANERTNAAIPDIDTATRAEYAVYDERYRASEEAKREWFTAMHVFINDPSARQALSGGAE